MSEPVAWPEALQYGGTTFRAASEFLARHRSAEDRGWRLAPRRRDVSGLVALVVLLVRLPRLRLVLTSSAAGERMRAHLEDRAFGLIPKHRLAKGVLLVPGPDDRYRSGRSRRALRNNLHRAEREGITCDTIEDPEERRQALDRLAESNETMSAADHAWFDRWRGRCAEPGRVWQFARDADGAVIGVSAVSVDRECAMLEVLGSKSHAARWVLQACCVESLQGLRVRFVFTVPGNALTLSPEVQYIQRLLGYSVVHLSVHPRDYAGAGGFTSRRAARMRPRAARNEKPARTNG